MLTYQESIADRACKLECCRDLPPIHEFVGPVKIVLMDAPKDVYVKKVWISALIGLAHLLMVIPTMIVLFFTLAFDTPLAMNLHIVLCTLGHQLFIPSAILMVNNLHGPAAHLKHEDRKFQHLFLQICGIVCASVGAVLVMLLSNGSFMSKLTLHSLAGLVACGLIGASALTGPGAYFARGTGTIGKVGKRTHAFCGVPAFISSSFCFSIGIFNSAAFDAWAFHPDLVYILIVLCVVYTLIIIITPVMKIIGKAP